MLSMILLSMLMIRLSILSVIGICSQGSTIGICPVCAFAYFYWHMHDFGHAYADTYAHFFPVIFVSF